MNLLEQETCPASEYRTFAHGYDSCPQCGGVKRKVATRCGKCRYAKPELRQPEDTSIRHIALTRERVAVVDAVDYEWLSKFKWHATSGDKPYAARRERGKGIVLMHRAILGIEGHDTYADHINGCTVDNRRSNIRIATPIENAMNRGKNKNNTSGYKGVVRSLGCKSEERWTAQITIDGRIVSLGSDFKTPEEAHEAYSQAAIERFGEFARCS